MAEARILMDGAYAHLAACYKRTTDHCIAELNGCLTPGAWLKSSCQAGRFFQESRLREATDQDIWNFPLTWLPWDPAQTLLGWPCVGRAPLAGAAANGAAPDL